MRQNLTYLALIGLLFLSVGCSGHRGILDLDCCATTPAGAIPKPAGSSIRQWEAAQIRAALVDQLVLYRSDFVDSSSSNLSPAALNRLERSVQSGLCGQMPWIIEPSAHAALDQARVQEVIDLLTQYGVTPVGVMVAEPPALGMRGEYAEAAAGSVNQ